MILTFIHSLLSYALPFACGFAIGTLCRSLANNWLRHVAACLLTSVTSIVTGYFAFLVFSGVMTGSWPSEISLAGLAYALAWFSIVAVFTSVPVSLAGYVCGVALARKPAVC